MILRRTIRGAVVLAVFIGSLIFSGTASPGSAEFEILKQVEGTAPLGTRFRVTVSCQGVTIQPNGASQVVFTFAADGTPLTPAAFRFEGSGTCTVTETDTGAATSLTYECFQTAGPETGANGVPPPCPPSGPQTAPPALNVTTPRSPGSVVITNRIAVRFTG
jgi:hypothetical protein